jgi:Tfp pilus assembly protein PilV
MVKFIRGISLIEVLIALLLFSAGMLAAGLTALKSLNLARDGLYQTKATDLAQMQQEAILARGLADIGPWQHRVKTELPQGTGHLVQNKESISVQVSWQPNKTTKRRSISVECPHP